MLLISKEKVRGESKCLLVSSQLGKRKQNIWSEVSILASDVLILSVQCHCNSQIPVFLADCHSKEKKQMFPFVFDVVQNHLHLLA